MRLGAMLRAAHVPTLLSSAPSAACRTAAAGRGRCLALRVHAAKAKGFGTAASRVVDVPTVTKLEWQSPLQIAQYPDPCLRAINARIGVFDESLLRLAKEMIAIMYEDDGVGLAAPQVGVNVRLMVFNPDGREKPGAESILVNPEIVESVSLAGKELGQEGCLSFPKIYGDVERNREIIVKAQNEKGEPVRLHLTDPWIARIFQHEYDHLQGVLFFERMKPAMLETVRPQLVELEEAFVQQRPTVKVQRLAPPKISKGFGAVKK